MAIVELVRGSIGVPGLAEDEYIVTSSKRVGEEGTGADVDIGIVTWSLTSGRAIKVPFGKFFIALYRTRQSLPSQAKPSQAIAFLISRILITPVCRAVKSLEVQRPSLVW